MLPIAILSIIAILLNNETLDSLKLVNLNKKEIIIINIMEKISAINNPLAKYLMLIPFPLLFISIPPSIVR